jgi:type IV secretion system protein TrbL
MSRTRRRRALAAALGVAVGALLPLSAGSAQAAKPDDGCGASNLLADAACEVADEVGDVALAPVRHAADSVMDTVTSWVADSAQWVLTRVVNFIDESTSPDLGVAWFQERYRFMLGLGALVVLPIFLLAVGRSVLRQDLHELVRTAAVHLPVAILGTFLAVYLTQSLLVVTDQLSAAVGARIADDTSHIFDAVGRSLSGAPGVAAPALPSFVIFIVALLLIIGAFFVWLELLVRSAAVTVSVFFMPLILAGFVWPGGARWTKRMIETLFALIISKFVIVAVISLATAALADPGGGGFGTVMGACALMLMAAFAPFAILKLMPVVEASAANQLEALRYRHQSQLYHHSTTGWILSVMHSRMRRAGAPGGGGVVAAVPAAGAGGTVPVTGLGAAGSAKRAGAGTASRVERASGRDDDGPRGSTNRSVDSSPSAQSPTSRLAPKPKE